MMHKKLLTLVLALTLVSSVTQVFTMTYPSKSTLKKADHIVSLATTGTFVSSLMMSEMKCQNSSDLLAYAWFATTVTNIITNGAALKHDRSVAAILKLLLPVSTLGGVMVYLRADKDTYLEDAGLYAWFAGIAINGIKNIWDVYSLVKRDQSESTQRDA